VRKIDCITDKTEKALSKLRQQSTKGNLFGCKHFILSDAYYATSKEKLQQLLQFHEKLAFIQRN
jgi:hypothetical protein